MAQDLTIEVWSDVACPWCYIGKRRLEAALRRFPHAAEVKVRYRAFELDPSAPGERDPTKSQVERLAEKYGTSIAQAQAMVDRVARAAADEGLEFDFVRMRSGNTFLLHRLLHLGLARGVQEQVKERFLRAYFCEGKALGKAEVASATAIEAGLDPDEVAGVVGSDLYADAVRADQREARELGISGVPFFLLNRRYAVSGAQPAELMLQALERTWDETVQAEPAASEGATCGPDGCEI